MVPPARADALRQISPMWVMVERVGRLMLALLLLFV
jgi:hypothetical protein